MMSKEQDRKEEVEMKILDENKFNEVNSFGKGQSNDRFAQYFTGNSYLNPLTNPKETAVFLANVTFEPGCRNNWHIHHAKSGGGQLLTGSANTEAEENAENAMKDAVTDSGNGVWYGFHDKGDGISEAGV